MRPALLGLVCAVVAGCAARVAPPPTARVAAPTTLDQQRALFSQAHQAIAQQHYAQALPMLDALCPGYAALADYCLHYRALARARTGDVAGAEALWTELAASQPQSIHAPRAALERGRLRHAAGDLVSARALLESARASGGQPVALQAQLELAEIDVAAGNPADAQVTLMSVRTTAPGTPLGNEAKQRVDDLRRSDPSLAPHGTALEAEVRLLLKERDYPAALGAIDQLLAESAPPERPERLRLRADAELGSGQLEQGLATLQEVVRQYPDSGAAPEAQFRYASLLWNRDRNLEAQQAFVEFRRRYPGHERTPEVLYALARIAQGEGHSEDAAAAFTELADAYPTNALAHEAGWRVGWIRYQEGRWREAAAAFERVAPGADANAAADAQYWRARALDHASDAAAAQQIYRAITAAAPASYYALWSEQRLGGHPAPPRVVSPPARPRGIGDAPPAVDPYHWTRANELQAAALPALAREELLACERATADPRAATSALTDALQSVDGYRDAIRLASARGVQDPRVLYPLAFWPQVSRQADKAGVDPLLVVALMRQESLFDPTAHSPADARGLMQLVPGTANRVARRIGQPTAADQLYDPEANITLGVAHLQQLLQAYQGDRIKALAAYNGGEEAVAKWERRFGSLEPDEFVESITYRETRDYVKRVIGNYRRYQQQYGGR